jgi:hypothetical protein
MEVAHATEGDGEPKVEEGSEAQPKQTARNSRDHHAVLSVGDTLEIRNENGSLRIIADSDLKRTFMWDGASRTVVMERRKEPWKGAVGLYWPGPGDHWEDHKGVTRGVVQEQTRDFKDEASFREWLRGYQEWYDAKHTPDGIVAGWSITPSRGQLNVELWRITIAGNQPEALDGGSTDWLTWTRKPE